MQISQMFKRKPCVFSIECFPPKQTANFDKMKDTLRTMRTLNPDFISVTYGAGGSTGGVSTVEVAEFLKNDLNVEPLAHMICMGSDKAKAAQLLDQLNAAGVRNVLTLRGASSTELDPNTLYPVIDLMADQNLDMLGHTMRLGKYRCALKHDTNSYKAYAQEEIWERHRHRYEFNNDYLTRFEEGGMTIAGKNPDRNLVEIVEIPDHPWYVAVQFHPELKSRPNRPHPLFRDFVGAAIKHQEQV